MSRSTPEPGRLDRGRRLLAGLGDNVGDRLGDGVRTLRHHARDLLDGDDPPPDVPLADGSLPAEALADPELADPELSALDDAAAWDDDGHHASSVAVFERINLDLDGGTALWELFTRVDPGPELPLTAGHTVGLGPLIQRFLDVTDPPALPERAVTRVLDLVTDRYTVTVAPDGVTLRGFRQRRHTPWSEITGITVTNRYEALKSGAILRIIRNSVQVPIPGLRWLLQTIFGALTRRLERLLLGEEEVRAWRATAGPVVTDVVRRGVDYDLNGPLLIVALLAKGTTAAIVAEAEARSIPIIDTDHPVASPTTPAGPAQPRPGPPAIPALPVSPGPSASPSPEPPRRPGQG